MTLYEIIYNYLSTLIPSTELTNAWCELVSITTLTLLYIVACSFVVWVFKVVSGAIVRC